MAREQYEVRWKDYYQILQVHPTAEPEVILAAYRKLAQAYHPDLNHSSDSTEKFQQINEAKEVLTDHQRRALYDQAYQARQGSSQSSNSDGASEERRNTWGSYRETNRDQQRQQHSQHQERTWGRATGQRHWDSWGGNSQEQEAASDPSEQEQNRPASRQHSQFWVLNLLSYLVDRLSPDPDESQRIVPWPSWSWQRCSLGAAIPLAVVVCIVSLSSGAWFLSGLAVLLMGASIYSGIQTGWMRATRDAPMPARIAGGACIAVSGISYTLALAYAVLIIAFIAFVAIAGWVMLRTMFDEAFK